MGVEAVLLILLVLIFIVGTTTDMNIGLLSLVVAYFAGTFLVGLDTKTIVSGFPQSLFLMLAGIMLLMSVANENGTVDWVVSKLLHYSGGQMVLFPWALFLIALVVGSFGTATAPILFIVGMGFAIKYNINPLLFGALVLHGNQAGLFSPIAPYGVLFRGLSIESGYNIDSNIVYGLVVAFHIVLALTAFFAFGGAALVKRRIARAEIDASLKEAGPLDLERGATIIGFLIFLVGVAVFKLDVGFLAMIIASILMLLGPKQKRAAVIASVPWNIALIVCGVLVYVGVMQEANAFTWLMENAMEIGAPKPVALFLNYISAAVTAVSSTFGTFGFLIPMSAPLVETGGLPATLLLSGIAISAAVTDISPFSPFGAMFLSTSPPDVRQSLLRSMLIYVGLLILIMPIITWITLIALT